MTRSVPHTKLRNGVYHYNRRIPTEILNNEDAKKEFFSRQPYAKYFPGGAVCRGSLKTRDRSKALSLVAELNEEFERRCQLGQASILNLPPVLKASSSMVGSINEELTALIATQIYDQTVSRYKDLEDAAFSDPAKKEVWNETIDRIEEEPERYRRAFFGEDPQAVDEILQRALEQQGISIDRGTPEYRKLLSAARNALRTGGDQVQNLIEDEGHIEPNLPLLQTGRRLLEKGGNVPLRTIFEKLNTEDQLSPTWKEKCSTALEVYEDIFSTNRSIAAITKSDAKRFCKQLERIPANKTQRFPGLNTLQAIEANTNLANPHPTLSEKTVTDGYIAPIRRLFNEAVDEELIESNPFLGITKGRQRKQKSDLRAYTEGELATLFSQPLFTGCKSIERPYGKNCEGKHLINDHRFWAPLMALYTGARVAELGGLRKGNVILDEKIPYIRIRKHPERSVKTDNGDRDIPLPTEFLDFGFREYFRSVSNNRDDRLFPDWELRQKGKGDRATYSEAKWLVNFRRHIKRLLGAKGEKSEVTFHSLRRNYKQALKRMEISDTFIDEVVGHDRSQMDKVYANNIITADVTGKKIVDLSFPAVKAIGIPTRVY